ncbi:MAG: hypothetical protein B6D39_11735 [Anaerolineae bacterium UTCFX2]|jgi:nanoRNase/pAp phosphatase (c-di-AMP/oligoRNAs hydrolase)|nr:DHH family phosphoesterase [Anaerolineales bacterium]OQY88087.1 MAG: hypothetical protein B6D39_11735 [Anaerolineae bacterium UTCFX2]
MKTPDDKISTVSLEKLKNTVGRGPALIMTHDNPDPDALASGSALAALFEKAWNIKAQPVYSGLIARPENKAMLEILTPEWARYDPAAQIDQYPIVALVDTQPGAGNNRLPAGFTPQIVIDHHYPIRDGLDGVKFLQIQTEIGATCSIVYQYLEAAGVEVGSRLATAIFYGIQTDTQGLSRGGSPVDQEIYLKLVNQIDRKKLIEVVQAGLPRDYFQAFSDALKATWIYGSAVVANLGDLHRPDFVAEMADALVRLEHVRAVLCLGYHQGVLYLSLRTPNSEPDAGLMIQRIIVADGKAGGHGTMAGGQIRIGDKSSQEIASIVQARFLQVMGETGAGERLLS